MTQTTSGLCLLVVDDEEQILELLDLTLSYRGFEVTTARSGPEALALARDQKVDAVVMDVLMTPWDGFETVRRWHRELPGPLPPVVFLSGISRPGGMPDLEFPLVQTFLLKPFRPSQLVEAIEQVWMEAQHRRQN